MEATILNACAKYDISRLSLFLLKIIFGNLCNSFFKTGFKSSPEIINIFSYKFLFIIAL